MHLLLISKLSFMFLKTFKDYACWLYHNFCSRSVFFTGGQAGLLFVRSCSIDKESCTIVPNYLVLHILLFIKIRKKEVSEKNKLRYWKNFLNDTSIGCKKNLIAIIILEHFPILQIIFTCRIMYIYNVMTYVYIYIIYSLYL
uniref:Uncharacterized protein n=1 Tax=Heterorhabditis bacteriophora TaxID=37862 RepID=A0A1I7WJP4_HETBA